MIKRIFAVLLSLLIFISLPAMAGEREDAIESGKKIMDLMVGAKYQTLWDSHTSVIMKKIVPEGAFMSNMAMGRSMFGPLKSSQIVDTAFSTSDPQSGYTGKIYAITFKNEYAIGSFFERVVVTLESDNTFRMSGIWGTPIPKSQ